MTSINKPIQLGLCCQNLELKNQKPPIYCSRKMIIRKINEEGIDSLKKKIIQNLDDVLKMIKWNEENNIKVFRLSSELFPHKSNPKIDAYSFDFAKDLLLEIGNLAKKYNHRLTFHPGQYNVIGTPNKEVLEKTILDLEYHAIVLDLMGLSEDSVMVVHGGGIYGDKKKTIERWCKQYEELPEMIKKRLVLENCEKCYSIEDCLIISDKVNIPVVFDTHHYECYNILHPNENLKDPVEYVPQILETWKRKKIKPKFRSVPSCLGNVGTRRSLIGIGAKAPNSDRSNSTT